MTKVPLEFLKWVKRFSIGGVIFGIMYWLNFKLLLIPIIPSQGGYDFFYITHCPNFMKVILYVMFGMTCLFFGPGFIMIGILALYKTDAVLLGAILIFIVSVLFWSSTFFGFRKLIATGKNSLSKS